jgi:diguanylate cyclase (GGDEF)-like protein
MLQPSHSLRHEPMQVVLIEDSPDYADLVTIMVSDALGPKVEVSHHQRVSEACAHLRETDAACALLDLSLPDAQGLEGLRRIQATAPSLPIVVLSGHDDERIALEALQEGAQDYLVKQHADGHLLGRAIRYAIERKRSELELAHFALHDQLTGLPNRTLFNDRLELALARSERRPSSVAVLFMDLDRFKVVNDSLGHSVGDDLLIEAASRLSGVVRPSDSVARFGGDEFMVLCEDLSGKDEAVSIAKRLEEAIARPFQIEGHEIFIRPSIGIAFARHPAEQPDVLIRDADQTMYKAKQRSSGIELFDEEMHTDAVRRLETENELHRALERGELELVYQPQVHIPTGGIFAVEALLRWNHPERGLLEPAEFVPLAEETGLIVTIGEWVLDEACRQLARWTDEVPDASELVMSVNLSPRQLMHAPFVETVAATLARTGVDPSHLCLEVTESTVAGNPERVGGVLNALKRLGVSLSVDDFGTGYSSLTVLDRYPMDVLKIDRSFVERLGEGEERRAIFAASLRVAEALHLTAVAEGVEEPEQLQELEALGCEAAQGYYFARPASGRIVGDLLARDRVRIRRPELSNA